ncbi:tumor necrosis factor receptor superfamily member 6 isoform X2 [Nothoprocta perdicaria]|nr:tumor necrosis factor receptor superfamily member 6 isoform X2 [Nothoprocta perdicaria]
MVGLIIESQCKNDTEAPIHRVYNKITARRIIARREIKCTADEYNLGGMCCKKCERGFVKNTNCPTNVREHCVQCIPGQEYVDHANDLDECLRCASCDGIFGLQIAKKCTPTQNTECTCAENFFCNSSGSCAHCDPCSTCGSNLIEKHCTPTSDTICKIKEEGSQTNIALAVCLPATVVAAGALIYCYIKKRTHRINKQSPGQSVPEPGVPYEMVPIMFADIDLSTHIPDIVGEMTLPEVKTFVRNHGVPEPVIDEILRDNANNTSEQKIKLFQDWHQRHGIKGAYETLIRSLRKLKMCTAADKIEKKLKAALASSQEVGQSYSDNRKQSTACTEEGGNSHLHNAEQGKSYSDHLEET